MEINFAQIKGKLKKITPYSIEGTVQRVIGITIEVKGIQAFIGELCTIYNQENLAIDCEVVGFRENIAILMPLDELTGIGPGCKVVPQKRPLQVKCSSSMLGKVFDGLGRPINTEDSPFETDFKYYSLENSPPNPMDRQIIKEVLPTGVRAIDGLLTCGKGQRIGIFAGSGVGKSTLLGRIAREADADVNVIALIGERGRELLEFIKKDLKEEGMKKSVIVCATSDKPALIRIKGALTATSIAEYYRDQGKNVILMMDSVTRFAMAQREVGLAVGEPPAQKGYTPSVFALLPKLMERAGTSKIGTITAFYTVLVDGDDMNEPIADATRGILDGHIVLSRKLANKNQYPPIDVLASISRLMSSITSKEHQEAASKAKNLLATYYESEDLINIGAYKTGASKEIDKAIKFYNNIIGFLKQEINDLDNFEMIVKKLLVLTKQI